MDQKICLDSDISIAIIKGLPVCDEFIRTWEEGEAVVSSLTVFELCLRDNNIEPVKDFLDNVEIIQFGGFESMLAAELHKQLKRKGKICQINDVFIAATAITNNCALATLNKKHFKNINGLKII